MKITVKKHFVTFLSPGTLFAEQTTKPIDSWDTKKAVEMARGIQERHAATPYGFYFTTRGRDETDLDSKEIKRSKMYYLGGTILTVKDIEARKDPADRILISKMKCNGWKRVVQNDNSWRWTQPLQRGDKVLDFPLVHSACSEPLESK